MIQLGMLEHMEVFLQGMGQQLLGFQTIEGILIELGMMEEVLIQEEL